MAFATKTRKPTASSRKRQGQHHRHNKVYLRPYWPYLPMLAILGLGLLVNSLWARGGVLGSQADYSAVSLLDATNQQRAGAGRQPLSLDPELSAAAQAKAEDMVTKDYWAHDSPDGRTPWSFISATGYQYQTAGENLAYGFGDAEAAVTGWMNSPAHRDNILNASYQEVGFGVAQSPNYQGHGPETVIVAEYGRPLTSLDLLSAPVSASEPAPAIAIKARNVSRIQLLTGGSAAWTTLAVGLVAGAALALVVLRHGYRLHRALNRGEMYIVHHPVVDIGFILIFTLGLLLTRSAGLIH